MIRPAILGVPAGKGGEPQPEPPPPVPGPDVAAGAAGLRRHVGRLYPQTDIRHLRCHQVRNRAGGRYRRANIWTNDYRDYPSSGRFLYYPPYYAVCIPNLTILSSPGNLVVTFLCLTNVPVNLIQQSFGDRDERCLKFTLQQIFYHTDNKIRGMINGHVLI